MVSTGMGGPSTAICIEGLARIGVDTFVRVGTCASTSDSVAIGGIVVPNGAVRMEGTGSQYLPLEFPAVPDFGLLLSLEAASLGLRAATVLVSATSYGQESVKDVTAGAYPAEFEERAVRVAVEALRLQIASDRARPPA